MERRRPAWNIVSNGRRQPPETSFPPMNSGLFETIPCQRGRQVLVPLSGLITNIVDTCERWVCGNSNRRFRRRCEQWDEERRSGSHLTAERWLTSSLPVLRPRTSASVSWCLRGGSCLQRTGAPPERRDLRPLRAGRLSLFSQSGMTNAEAVPGRQRVSQALRG